ncbi:hypothetical protein Hdeb2414_s0001g00033551 [Helianthus debilis subsp. tardiflorus]
MRKYWQAVYDLLNTSGFGYDKERNCVTTNAPGVWDAYLEVNEKKKVFRTMKKCALFLAGKDRAQGNRAKSVVEMEQEVNIEEQEHQRDDDFGEHSHNENTNASSQFEETSSGRSKKRKRTS